MKHVWLEGPAGHRVKLFNKGDFKRVLLQKMNNWVVVYIYEARLPRSCQGARPTG